MTVHKSTLEAPELCTVERLVALLSDMDLQAPVWIAMGIREEDGGLDVATISAVTQVKEPLEGVEVCLLVPSGALGKWFEELSAAEAATQGRMTPKGQPS